MYPFEDVRTLIIDGFIFFLFCCFPGPFGPHTAEPRLQRCVSQADELVSENLQLRNESAALEQAEERCQ